MRLPVTAHSNNDMSLRIDIARFAYKQSRKALAHTFGLHGVEGLISQAF